MRNDKGFTLIELVTVVVIVAILAAIAIPSFIEQARKSRRTQALEGLSDIQLRQERWRSNHPTYGAASDIGLPTSSNYTFAVTINNATAATAWSATATPTAGSPQASDPCGTYTFSVASGTLSKSYSGSGRCL